MPEISKHTKLVVIGAGPGGYVAAFLAADLGVEVTLIDAESNPGGVCLYRGCIPSKAFLHIAKVLDEARELKNCGVEFSEPTISASKIRDWKQNMISKMTSNLGQLCKLRKINYIQGRATFVDSKTLKIDRANGAQENLTFDHAILATGSRPITLPDLPDSKRILNSTTALELADIPKTLLVVGGGYIGLELGTVYAALGTKVSVVEMTPGLLPGGDKDLTNILAKRLQKVFQDILLETKVTKIEEANNGLKVSFEASDKKQTQQEFDKVLIAIGRKPNSSGLGLENTKVKIDKKGFILINAQRRTDDPSIYAIGDVAGEPMLAHKASHEGRVAVEAILGHKVAFEPKAIPAVVFTDPEIAWCGLTENEAQKQNRPIKVTKFPWGASGRATTLNRPEGITKLILDPETQHVLGVGIAGVGAGELISEGVLAVEMGALASDIKLSIHPHPTLSETFMESAEVFFGQSTHLYRPPKTS
ncbi:MAG: dihydrolipoyl dehydrogenase [Candidatus Omnitrophota bacterium]